MVDMNSYLEPDGVCVLEEHEQELEIQSSFEDQLDGHRACDELHHLFALEQSAEALENVLTQNGLESFDESVSLPSFESFESEPVVSMEGLGEVIKSIWQAIVNAVKRVWDAILGFFGKVKNQVGRLRKQNEKMRQRMSDVSGKDSKDKTIKIERDALQLFADDTKPKDAEGILEIMTRASEYGEVVFKDYSNRLETTGNKMLNALDGFDLKKPEESLNAMIEATKALNLDAVRESMGKQGAREISDKRWQSRRVLISKPLPGNKSLFFIGSKALAKENSVLALSERQRVRKFVLAKTHDKKQPKGERVNIEVVTSAEGIKLYQVNKLLIDQIESYDKIKEKLNKVRRDLEKAGTQLQKRADKAGDEIADNTDVYVKEALRYVDAYSIWAFNPSVDMASQMLSSIRAVISVCNKSASAYD